MSRSGWPFKLSVVALVAVLMAGIWLVLRGMGLPAGLSADPIAQWLNGQGALGPLLLILLMILAVVVGPIPTLPISAASGLAFGLFAGTAVAATGAVLGALVAFGLARLVGREPLRARLQAHPLFAADGSQRALFWIVFLTRLIPVFSFALVSYIAGVTAITAGRFALASLIGMLPMTLVFAGLGQAFRLHPLLSTTAALVVLAAMTLLPYYVSRRRGSAIARWLRLGGD